VNPNAAKACLPYAAWSSAHSDRSQADEPAGSSREWMTSPKTTMAGEEFTATG
jgi:hypothetical protein